MTTPLYVRGGLNFYGFLLLLNRDNPMSNSISNQLGTGFKIQFFHHSVFVNVLHERYEVLLSGKSLTDIQNRLGHENIQSTTVYTHMDLTRKQAVQNKFIEYMKSNLSEDPKINEWIDWENRKDILEWLDSL